MAVKVSTLSEFLLARIAEDEARLHSQPWWPYGSYIDGLGPRRLEVECEAKRRIVGMHEPEACWSVDLECAKCSFHEMYEGFNDEHEAWPCQTLRLLALPYRDHPDYQQEWAV